MRKIITTIAFAIFAIPALAGELSKAQYDDLIAFNEKFNQYAASYDIEGMMSLYHEDALWIAPAKAPAIGRDGVPRKTFTFLSENKGTLTHTVEELFISEDGSMALMIGQADVLVEKANLDITGTYKFVMKRVDDKWVIISDMFNYHDEK